jgi:hypothetical protein
LWLNRAMAISDASAQVLSKVPFMGVVGKLALVAVFTPLTMLGPIAYGRPEFLPTAFYLILALVAGLDS